MEGNKENLKYPLTLPTQTHFLEVASMIIFM